MTTRSRVLVAGAVVVAVSALAIWLVASGGDDEVDSSESTSSTTVASTTTTVAPTSTTVASTTTTVAPGTTAALPGPVTTLDARPGGGSGEIELVWGAVPDATGYRVLRADSPDGPFTLAAEIDVVTGETTAADDVVNLWSDQHSYVPDQGDLTAPDPSAQFSYVEYGAALQRCFRVVAIGESGPGPESTTVCGTTP